MRILLLLTSISLLLAACGEETPQNRDAENRTTLSFTYRNTTAATRATVPAEEAEKAIRDMDIFAFGGDGTFLRRLVKNADFAQTTANGQTTMTVSQDFLNDHAWETLVFYFVGNNAASTGGTHVGTFAGTADDFEELLTSPLADGAQIDNEGNPRAENITITPGTGGLLVTGKSPRITLAGKRTVPVELKRRVARFDIVNPKPADYLVSRIYITDARTQATVFAESVAQHAIAARSTDNFAGPVLYDGTLARCAFYLYPTDLATTAITLEVVNRVSGKKVLFDVVGADPNPVIEANKRYTLRLDPVKLITVLGVADWDDEEL